MLSVENHFVQDQEVGPAKEAKLLDVDGNVKMKKRKLNSTNPKYYPVKDEEVKDRKELIATIRKGRNRNINVYAVFSEIE